MLTNVCFDYHFHPVGQGLFASGCLFQSRHPQPQFLWVYDCGTATFKEAARWNGLVAGLKAFARGKAKVDLLTLSHFDMDHISGLTELLRQFEVDTLLLPYATLWERLEVALAGEVPFDSPGMNYVLDPVGFLRGLGTITRIVFVLPSDGGEEVPLSGSGPVPPRGSPLKLDGRTKRVSPEDQHALDFGIAAEMELLPVGGKLTVEALWEFVPYNRPRRRALPDAAFVAEVNRLRNALLAGTATERRLTLRELKQFYEDRLATNAQARNAISLFLYAGPVYATWDACKLLYRHGATMPPYPARLPCYQRVHRYAPGINGKCSLLYTGDGYLDSPPKFEHLKSYLQAERLASLAVFQVCHHGAKDNWHSGLAARLAPYLSIFCSDPARQGTRHPHQDVWNDFLPYAPVQVNPNGHTSGGWLLKH